MLREMSEIANIEKLKFTNEIEAIRNESTRLRQMGVNIIIVLSHCGLDRDRVIAHECGDYVDVIVGGHSHSFLYTPNAADVDMSNDVPDGPYPIVLTPKSGRERKVLVVHASAFTKYIGDLRVYFNAAGHVKFYDGNPIYLSNKFTKDPSIDAELVMWRNEVLRIGERIVGNTSVDLIHTECRHGECGLGNLVADALVSANEGAFVKCSIIHAAGLRNSFHSGDIHYGDIVAALPFENSLDILEIRGDTLHEIFEHSVSRSFTENEFVGINMLQVSGIKVTFNTTHTVGERVQSLEIKITANEYVKVNRNSKLYHVIVPSFLSSGGDGFTMLIKAKRKNQQMMLDIDAIEKYIALKSPIGVETVSDVMHQRIVMLR